MESGAFDLAPDPGPAPDPAVAPGFAPPHAAASTESDTAQLRVVGHLIGGFDPSEPGVPVITQEGTEVPAGDADRLIAKAAEHGVTVKREA